MPLSPQHRTFLVNEQILGPFVINFAFNAVFGWWSFREFAPIPIWSFPGAAIDLIGIFNGLPFVLALIATPIVRQQVRKGKVAPLAHGPCAYPVLRRLPRNLFWRATYLGIASWLVGAPIVSAALYLVGDRIELTTFWIVKGLLAGALGALMAPIAAFYVLAQESAEVRGASKVEPPLAPALPTSSSADATASVPL